MSRAKASVLTVERSGISEWKGRRKEGRKWQAISLKKYSQLPTLTTILTQQSYQTLTFNTNPFSVQYSLNVYPLFKWPTMLLSLPQPNLV